MKNILTKETSVMMILSVKPECFRVSTGIACNLRINDINLQRSNEAATWTREVLLMTETTKTN